MIAANNARVDTERQTADTVALVQRWRRSPLCATPSAVGTRADYDYVATLLDALTLRLTTPDDDVSGDELRRQLADARHCVGVARALDVGANNGDDESKQQSKVAGCVLRLLNVVVVSSRSLVASNGSMAC